MSDTPKRSLWGVVILLGLTLLVIADLADDIRSTRVLTGTLSNYLVWPDASPTVLKEVGWALLRTLEIAYLGTLIGIFVSVPAALLASDILGTSWISASLRLVLSFIRSIPLIFLGYILVSILGLGSVPGILAMTLYTIGVLSKMLLDEITQLEHNVVHSLRTTGASRGQILVHGILPEIWPAIVSFTLLRFEINVREASILGVVGAGGIGILLRQYGTLPPYDKLWTLVLAVFLVVIVIEWICRRVLRRIRQ